VLRFSYQQYLHDSQVRPPCVDDLSAKGMFFYFDFYGQKDFIICTLKDPSNAFDLYHET
jgi:hypothetical protein